VSQAAASIAQPDASGGGADGLAQLQREIAQQRPTQSLYQGFGSDTYAASASGFAKTPSPSVSGPAGSSGGAMLQEAPGLPGEDRNGVERLTGESDEQYVVRQTRLRDEARARMAAKFGNGGMMGGVGPSGSSGGGGGSAAAPRPGPSSGNYGHYAASSSHPGGIRSAPTSGNAPSPSSGIVPNLQGPPPAWAAPGGASTPPRNATPPNKPITSTDFFSSFGT
jgi:hypothetical protein